MKTYNQDYSVVEFNVIEVKKALSRLGTNLFIKEDILFGSIKDEYWNIPCIYHSSSTPEKDIKTTIMALKNVFVAIIEKDMNSIISWTISWNIEEKEIRVSCLGHVKNLFEWMKSFEVIPSNRLDFVKWLENQKKYLNDNFNQSYEKPSIKDICQYDGVLYMKRVLVDKGFALEPFIENDALAYSFKVPDKGDEYLELHDGIIKPVPAYIVKKSSCSKTKQDYLNSPFSKWLDEDVYTIIEETDWLSFYWSDKSIY